VGLKEQVSHRDMRALGKHEQLAAAREALRRQWCECYGKVEKEHEWLLG
jgi:hypothetical protein